MRKVYLFVIAVGLLVGGIVYAAPSVNVFRNIQPETTNTYESGTSTKAWLNVTSKNFCLTGDSCISSWPTGGSGGGATTTINGFSGPNFTFTTSTPTGLDFFITGSGSTLTFAPTLQSGYSIPLTASSTNWNTAFLWGNHASAGYLTSATAATTYVPYTYASSTFPSFSYASSTFQTTLTTGNLTATSPLQFNNTRQVIGGAAEVSVASGYGIPLTASTTEWTNFYNTPSGRITAGTNLAWSGNTLNGTMASSTIIAGGTATHSPSITFATSTDTNILLSVVCASATCTFNPSWTGTLADDRIASAATWNSKQAGDADLTQIAGFAKTKGNLIVADGTDWQVLGVGANGTVLTASSTASTGAVWAAVAGSGTVTSVDMTVPTGLAISGNPITTSGTLALSLDTGYVIPLTASTTEWATALQTKLSTTTAAATYEPILTKGNLTESITGLEFDATRQVIGGAAALSLTSGYNIPLTASTTDWNTAFLWGNHASAGYLTSATAATTYVPYSYASSSYATLWNLQAGSNISISTSSGVSIAVSSTPTFTSISATNASTTNLSIATNTYLSNVASCTNGLVTGNGGLVACNGSAFLTGNQSITLSGDVSGTGATSITTAIGNDKITEPMLKVVDSPNDEECFTYEETTGDFEWQSCSSGSISGTGTSGFGARWTAADALAAGKLIDNGTVIGVNATSSTVTFNLQGSAGLTPFNVASSTGDSLFSIGQNGSTTIASLGNGLVRSASGALYVDAATYLQDGCTDCINATEIEDIYLLLAGDSSNGNYTWTGVHDYSGGVVEITNGTGPTVDAAGEMALDTTDNQLLIADSGNTARVFGKAVDTIWTVTVASSSPAFINGTLLPIPTQLDGYTMTAIRCKVDSGTSKVVAVEDASANSTEDITCATTVTSDDGSITNATATAAEEMYIDFGASSGTPDYVTISVFGTWTVE